MPNAKTEKKTLRRALFQSIITGLVFPFFIIAGLYIGWAFGKNFGRPMDAVLTLAGALIGLIAGTSFLWWYVIQRASK